MFAVIAALRNVMGNAREDGTRTAGHNRRVPVGWEDSHKNASVPFSPAALQYAYRRYVGDDPKQIEAYEQEVLSAEIARRVYDLRTKAGLSQRELAKRVGTSASAVCRLEDADYDGHSLYLLKRIAQALDQRVEIRFVPIRRKHLQPA